MMRYIARMTGLGALVAAVIVALTALALTAEAQEPAPALSFTKTAAPATVDIGDTVTFTIAVTNTGGAASSSQTIQDLLPSGFTWVLGDRSLDCAIEDGLLLCEKFVVPAAYFDGITPVPGVHFVEVQSVAHACGVFPNDAWLVDLETDELTLASATLTVRCPATPTPTAPPPTPTATATPSPTATLGGSTPLSPIVVTATPTKTPLAFIPKPPNTGSGEPVGAADLGLNSFAYLGVLVILLGVGTLAFAVRRSR